MTIATAAPNDKATDWLHMLSPWIQGNLRRTSRYIIMMISSEKPHTSYAWSHMELTK